MAAIRGIVPALKHMLTVRGDIVHLKRRSGNFNENTEPSCDVWFLFYYSLLYFGLSCITAEVRSVQSHHQKNRAISNETSTIIKTIIIHSNLT